MANLYPTIILILAATTAIIQNEIIIVSGVYQHSPGSIPVTEIRNQ